VFDDSASIHCRRKRPPRRQVAGGFPEDSFGTHRCRANEMTQAFAAIDRAALSNFERTPAGYATHPVVAGRCSGLRSGAKQDTNEAES
jgi:hypothetical protein